MGVNLLDRDLILLIHETQKMPALQARWRYEIMTYYMASSVSGQDESNPALWLATWVGKMALSCPLRTTRRVLQEKFPQKPYNKSFIDQACSVKMAEYCPRSFFASLWTSTTSRSINLQKKNLTNIQPSGPHTWSITHIIKPVVEQMECSPQELNRWPCKDRLKLTIMKTLWFGIAFISHPSFMHYSCSQGSCSQVEVLYGEVGNSFPSTLWDWLINTFFILKLFIQIYTIITTWRWWWRYM